MFPERPLWFGLDGQPITMEAAELLFSDPARVIAKTIITTDRGQVEVSTVFLVLDHGYGDAPPVLWETMVFGGLDDMGQLRYCSREAAVAGHAEAVAFCRSAIDVDGAAILAEEVMNGVAPSRCSPTTRAVTAPGLRPASRALLDHDAPEEPRR